MSFMSRIFQLHYENDKAFLLIQLNLDYVQICFHVGGAPSAFTYLVLGSWVEGDVELEAEGCQKTHCSITAGQLVVSLVRPAGLLVRRSGGLGGHRRGNGGKGLMQDSGCKRQKVFN